MKTAPISFTLNGKAVTVDAGADEKLSSVLRRLGFKGVRIGCDEGICGACTVLIDGLPINSCHTYAFQATDRNVETIEALGTFEQPRALQTALADEGAVQCGFCIPGFILSAKALADARPQAGEDDLRLQLDGHLCRCTGYEKILCALKKAFAGKGGAS